MRTNRLKAYRFPAYQDFLKLGRERKGALFLDVGCCCGSDVRKAIVDGYPADQIIASDLNAGVYRTSFDTVNELLKIELPD